MSNYTMVTEHLRDRFLLEGHTDMGSVPMLMQTCEGKSYYRDGSNCWRMISYFSNVYSMDIPDMPDTFYYAGRAFGQFIVCLQDLPMDNVQTVIPNFHNTMSRYLDLEEAIARDNMNRVKDVLPEIDFLRARKERYAMISSALKSGEIPTRITHNDTNLNNILFDKKTHLPVAIIDLDTVMPSSPLYDFGDSIRIGTNTARDDEKDLRKVSCDLEMYRLYAKGWLESCGRMLTERELELLPYAALVITSEDCIRFLMDHINGDVYYNISYQGQNLDRCRTQLKMVEDLEQKMPKVKAFFSELYEEMELRLKLGA